MNTRSIILGFVFLFSSINIFSLTSSAHQLISSSAPQLANSPTRQLANSNYSRQWKKVDSLSGLGLPKSALQLVQEIYEQAKKEKNDAQYIKAIIYRLKLSADFREDVMVKSIKEVRAEINNAKEPVRQILESVLGEIYSNYSRNNRYRFQDRTQVMNNNSDSIQTWDLKTLSRRTERCYLLSLENPSLLKSIPVEKFEPILEQPGTNGDPVSKKTADPYRPTLYDFLAWRALDYFSSSLNEDKVTVDVFTLDKSSYFSQAAGFASMKFDFPGDSSSSLAYAIGLYRDLAAFHLPDKDQRALIDEEIHRFQFIRENAIVDGKDSLYFEALKKLEQSVLASPYSTDVTFALAQYLDGTGASYHPLESQKHKWDLKDAKADCDNAVLRFPKSPGADNCKILAGQIQKPALEVKTEDAVIPGKPSLGVIEFRNMVRIYFRLAKTNPEDNKEKTTNRNREELIAYYCGLPFQTNWSLDLPNDGDFQSYRMEIRIPQLPSGFYILIASSDPDFKDEGQVIAWASFFSTQISYISQRSDKNQVEFYILDRESGIPLKNVIAESFITDFNYNTRKYENRKTGDYKTDEEGHLSFPASERPSYSNLFLRLQIGDDIFYTDNFYQYPLRENTEKPSLKTFFFTDRGIYRPGQTVYFKGILLEKYGDKYSIKPGVGTTTVFTDANGQKIAEQSFTTNTYGSFNGSFAVPQGILLGLMNISDGSGSVSISVEEYKRPTFEVSFVPMEGNYRLDDSVTLVGKAVAYAGNNIDGANVKYRVVRAARFPYWDRWWFPLPYIPETEIARGTLRSGTTGNFNIRFKAVPDLNVDPSEKPVFDYTVFADVTDINGETQSANESVSVGYASLLIGMDIPQKLNLLRDTLFHLASTNLNGRKTPALVSVILQRLHQPERLYRQRKWDRPDLMGMKSEEFHAAFPNDVYDDEDNSGKWAVEQEMVNKVMNTESDSIFRISSFTVRQPGGSLMLANGSVLSQGTYLLTLKAKDPDGQEVETKTVLTAYDPGMEVVAVRAMSWFVPMKTSGEPGEKASFLIGSGEKDVNILYEIRVHDSLTSRTWLKLNNAQTRVEIPIKEAYRGNFSVNFIFIRHNRSYQQSQLVTVPFSNKKLDIRFETFRDKLYPGQQEEWKIRIMDAAKKGVNSEFLASMYDASLDVFAPASWSFSIFPEYFSTLPWEVSGGFRISSGSYYPLHTTGGEFLLPKYEQLNWFDFAFSGGSRNYGRYKMLRDVNLPMEAEKMTSQDAAHIDAVPPAPAPGLTPATEEKPATGVKGQSKEERMTGIQIRKDFRETAFFYPSLVTDSSGNLEVRFTVPESLTKWRILGFGYTKQLEYGWVEKEVVTRKDLMVFPNVPRFVRQGDTVVFSAKVVNLSDRALTGDVELELSNAISMKPLALITGIRQESSGNNNFQIPLGESASVSWKLAIPDDPSLSLLQFRITAKAGNFSDGEERVVPVLTNRMLVTEAMPLPVRGKAPVDFRFDKLISSSSEKTLKNYKLTLEFSSNPAWYAVQALPTMDDPRYPNADNIFRSYYTNSIAFYLANSNPAIKQVFESWKTYTNDALVSNLIKNEQLKSALIQETPWVMEARDETMRKHRLSLFFDLNNMESRLTGNLKKLIKMQAPSGGWPWFDGMKESRYITQDIVTGFGHLDHLGIKKIRDDQDTWNMVVKAIGYLDGEMVKDYQDIRKYFPGKMDDDHLGATQIQYLYARTYFLKDVSMNSNTKEAFDYFRKQAQVYWLKNDLYTQGMIALALNRLGNKDVPQAILRSLSEKALHSPEMGMYWAAENGYEWYQAPIGTQALLIEAYEEISADPKPVDEMKIWLLKQKQTQDWKTGSATAEACYALILRGTDLLADQPDVKINLGKEIIDPEKLADTKVEAGTGYFQVYRDGKEITPDMGNVRIVKSNEGVAWGALYRQYFEDLDKITPHQTPLKVERKLFIEQVTAAGKVLQPIANSAQRIANGESIKIGDKIIVRIILSVDRNLEFVHMKDLRASAFEPLTGDLLSGYRYQDGLGYYQSTTDLAMNYFFDYLPKGTWVFEYPLVVNAAGEYSNGITTVQCMYAPEFGAHSEGLRVEIGK